MPSPLAVDAISDGAAALPYLSNHTDSSAMERLEVALANGDAFLEFNNMGYSTTTFGKWWNEMSRCLGYV